MVMLQIKLCPLLSLEKPYVEVLISSTCECVLIWKKGLCKFNQDISGSYSFKTSLLIRSGKFGHRHTIECHVKTEAETGVMDL